MGAFRGPIDILFLQEHKLDFGDCANFWKLPTGCTFLSPPLGTRGVTCISLSDALLPFLVGHGIIIPSRVQWIILLTRGRKIGFLNIYAPNNRGACVLWKELLSWAPITNSWIIEGDFNMVELPLDMKGGKEGGIHSLQRAL